MIVAGTGDSGSSAATSVTVGHVVIELAEGDITDQSEFDAIVNAANAELMPGGGVAGAIHRAAGPELAQECRALAPIRPGESVITGGHGLPNRWVIHCLGPVYGVDEPADELLASCYLSTLELAEEHGVASVAFPAISTGAFGYPMEDAAAVGVSTVLDVAGRLQHAERVRFVLFGSEAVSVHSDALARLSGSN